jgi:hypothetical protein
MSAADHALNDIGGAHRTARERDFCCQAACALPVAGISEDLLDSVANASRGSPAVNDLSRAHALEPRRCCGLFKGDRQPNHRHAKAE